MSDLSQNLHHLPCQRAGATKRKKEDGHVKAASQALAAGGKGNTEGCWLVGCLGALRWKYIACMPWVSLQCFLSDSLCLGKGVVDVSHRLIALTEW